MRKSKHNNDDDERSIVHRDLWSMHSDGDGDDDCDNGNHNTATTGHSGDGDGGVEEQEEEERDIVIIDDNKQQRMHSLSRNSNQHHHHQFTIQRSKPPLSQTDEQQQQQERGKKLSRSQKSRRKRASTRMAMHGGVSFEELQDQRLHLPITKAKKALMRVIRENRVLVLVGETGSGKTTQIPQYIDELLRSADAGSSNAGMVGVTQPRRVAATTIAKRVSAEMGTVLGREVGYSIRFEDCTSPYTRIKYMTDGMLLRELQIDPMLTRYAFIILDEAHERTLHTDVLFGILKRTCQKRPDLRLIIMSATLEAQAFSDYYGGAKIIYVSGRQFPVDIMYCEEPQSDYVDASVTTVLQIHIEEEYPGDILVFLTGQEEIESAAKILEDKAKLLPPECAKLLICPIFSHLPYEKQLEVFEPTPPGCRKVVLATNIAETSITINGIKHVVDCGMVKSRAYDPRNGMEALKVVPISKASARQRAGRAGREQAGKCFRLFTEEDFESLQDFTLPEIVRSNLATVVLQMKSMGIDDIVNFDFMDAPSKGGLISAMEVLKILGALDKDERLTQLGKQMASFPLDPMFAVALLRSPEFGCVEEMLSIVSMLSVESIFFAPYSLRERANKARLKFAVMFGDHLTLLRVYREYTGLTGSKGDRIEWCLANFINHKSMDKVLEIRAQLLEYLENLGIEISSCGRELKNVRKCMTAGFFLHAAQKIPQARKYRTLISNKEVYVHPTSILKDPLPEFVIFNRLVLTSKEYMRDITAIDSEWLTEVAPKTFAHIDFNKDEEAASDADVNSNHRIHGRKKGRRERTMPTSFTVVRSI